MAYKTPGVFVEEISTFPPSVVPVETAIPAFIGYTEQAEDADGTDLSFTPTRITSLLDFREKFGGDFVPSSYDVTITNPQTANTVGAVAPQDANDNDRRYYLYASLRHFYANGGGACYIVSVGSYTDAPAFGDTVTPAGLRGGLFVLEAFDEPTLLLFPDGVSLSATELGSLQQASLAQCRKLQDRFTIMDLREGNLEATIGNDPVDTFRNEVGTNNLRYGAAYYPWLSTIYRPDVRFRDLNFVDAVPNPIPDATIDALTGEATIDALVPAVRTADGNVDAIVAAVNAVPMTGGGNLAYTRGDFGAISDDYASRVDTLRQTTPTTIGIVRPPYRNVLHVPRGLALSLNALLSAGLPAELTQALQGLSNDAQVQAAIVGLISLEKNVEALPLVAAGRTDGDVASDYSALDTTPWITPHNDTGVVPVNADNLAGANPLETAMNVAAAMQPHVDTLIAAALSVFEAAEFLADEAQKQMFEEHPVMRSVLEQVVRTMSVLPAAGAVAGIYAAVDRTRGVWKAPANVSLTDISGPTVKINDAAQSDLNVHTTGKSVNAIRAFAGKGSLIWGARTLAGNDNEWRYVSVRRFFNMAEESIKKASEPFTFEPNDANTWIRVRAMIENFLTVQWRQGALAGSTPQQAFFVKVGLGETMTAQDILEGKMIIEIGMAVVRPAEFIILKFAHKMQVS